MTGKAQRAHQQTSHAGLAQHEPWYIPAPHSSARLDAIIVPTARSAKNLKHAIRLATETNCHLVVLCSREANSTDVIRLLGGMNFTRATVVDVPAHYTHKLFEFTTTDWIHNDPSSPTRGVRNSDLSLKRNIGLALARSLRWKRIFFLDDDIRDVEAASLNTLISLLGKKGPGGAYRTAGMTVKEFPDNSVVCHARRDVKEDQDVFVSGSVLAVDCTTPFAFFPDIYNEDWLFFYRDAACKRLACPGFNARQEPYDPFANPLRAAGEEFGDVIAEGLYSLLHGNRGLEDATREYWSMFLADRRRIIDDIISRLHFAPDNLRDEITEAIGAARRTLGHIQPGMCVQYIRLWQDDLARWKESLKKLPRARSVMDALRELGLNDVQVPLGSPDTSDIDSCRKMTDQESHALVLSGHAGS